jgi:hypothetical protein
VSYIRVVVGIYCDGQGCGERTADLSREFRARALAPGWTRWYGKRRRMDYCPAHSARPKSPTMQKVY